MLTAEVKINGVLLGYAHVVNTREVQAGATMYRYEFYRPEKGVVRGTVLHRREEGAYELVRLIMAELGREGSEV